MRDVQKPRVEVQRYGSNLMISASLTSEEKSLLDGTTVWNEEVCWNELGAAVSALRDDAGQAYPDMTEWSGRRLVRDIGQGEAPKAGARQQAKDCLWDSVDFLTESSENQESWARLRRHTSARTVSIFPREDFVWWVTTGHSEPRMKAKRRRTQGGGAPTGESPMNGEVTIASQ